MADQGSEHDPRPPRAKEVSVDEVIDLVKDYVRQETVGPLKGAGRWLGLGVAGAFLIGLGLVLVLLGLLRLIQTEWADTFDGAWSWAPYAIVLVVCSLAIVLALSRVKKTTLGKEPS